MHNLILFHTVTNSDGELLSKPHNKLKNKENLIHADAFSFHKIKIFLSNVRPQSRRRKGGDVELNSFSYCHKYRSRIWVWTAEQTEK